MLYSMLNSEYHRLVSIEENGDPNDDGLTEIDRRIYEFVLETLSTFWQEPGSEFWSGIELGCPLLGD